MLRIFSDIEDVDDKMFIRSTRVKQWSESSQMSEWLESNEKKTRVEIRDWRGNVRKSGMFDARSEI